MSFFVAADAYDRFMGRYSVHLSPQLAELAGVGPGQRVLDVGCGPGALTVELVARVGADSVTAIDPSAPFVEAARARHPGVTVEEAAAEALPFPDDAFDAALAQLVVHFMRDPIAGIGEMRRVTRSGGVVAASVWDHAGGHGPLSRFWTAVRELDGAAPDESDLPGAREGQLVAFFEEGGLRDVEQARMAVTLEHRSFDEWWEPYLGGVGPAGAYVASLDPDRRAVLRDHLRSGLPEGPFTETAVAWAARGIA